MSFFSKIKKKQYYVYVTLFFMGVFFIGNYYISKKVESEVKIFIDYMVAGNLRGKYYVLKQDYDKLNSFLVEVDKMIEGSKVTSLESERLKEKLSLKAATIISENSIDQSFVFLVENKKVAFDAHYNINDSVNKLVGIKNINEFTSKDTIIKIDSIPYNRKVFVKEFTHNLKVVFGYDINLLKHWKVFSESFSDERAGYSVLFNGEGVCVLHPEPQYIGEKLDYFKNISVQEIIDKRKGTEGSYITFNELHKEKVMSDFLSVEVFRYFDVIKTETGNPLILVANYPVEIIIAEHRREIMKSFSLMIGLSMLTFLVILGVSRWYLRRQYAETLRYEQERKKLAISNEQYQQKNAVLQLNQLRKKMNPHFLFNTLNSLHVLIGMNKELSQQFVLELSEVYRYLLEDREGNLVTVKEELNFLKRYLFLLEIRFSESLKVVIKDEVIAENQLKKIPFLALETLVENAIKHNEITKKNPLEVVIVFENEFIIVMNNYRPRKNENANSYKIGLSYLENCYHFYGINTFKAGVEGNKFKCILPLLP